MVSLPTALSLAPRRRATRTRTVRRPGGLAVSNPIETRARACPAGVGTSDVHAAIEALLASLEPVATATTGAPSLSGYIIVTGQR